MMGIFDKLLGRKALQEAAAGKKPASPAPEPAQDTSYLKGQIGSYMSTRQPATPKKAEPPPTATPTPKKKAPSGLAKGYYGRP
jgi:hypothetical protein